LKLIGRCVDPILVRQAKSPMLLTLLKAFLAARSLSFFLHGAPDVEDLNRRMDQLAARVNQLEAQKHTTFFIHENESQAAILFLIGIFCALWAQNTDRNPWLWFFLGLLFSFLTVLLLLAKNSDDRRKSLRSATAP
jgi:hypothetical protein